MARELVAESRKTHSVLTAGYLKIEVNLNVSHGLMQFATTRLRGTRKYDFFMFFLL